MNTPPLAALGAAVRRHLLRGRLVAALEQALLGTAALAGLAAGLRVAGIGIAAVVGAAGLLWLALPARALWRRPGDGACALWADRHLGGASAYSTLLEAGPSAARRRLESWAAARSELSLRLLRERRADAAPRERRRLARATATALLVLALAALVPTGAGPRTTPQPDVAATAPPPVAAAGELASEAATATGREIADALQAQAAGATDKQGAAHDAAPAPTGASGADVASTDAGAPAGKGPAPDAASIGAGPPPPGATTAVAAAGLGAGDGRDDKVGLTHLGAIARHATPAPKSSNATAERSASDQAGLYDGIDTKAAATASAAAPAAATAPIATADARLTPTQNRYVQAWMQQASPSPR
ncbi:MAG: hypothetical protein KGN16_00480 [Burkholderiales bacterium]|nr:hypothetical protein [Burkholderiales bacterium]